MIHTTTFVVFKTALYLNTLLQALRPIKVLAYTVIRRPIVRILLGDSGILASLQFIPAQGQIVVMVNVRPDKVLLSTRARERPVSGLSRRNPSRRSGNSAVRSVRPLYWSFEPVIDTIRTKL